MNLDLRVILSKKRYSGQNANCPPMFILLRSRRGAGVSRGRGLTFGHPLPPTP